MYKRVTEGEDYVPSKALINDTIDLLLQSQGVIPNRVPAGRTPGAVQTEIVVSNKTENSLSIFTPVMVSSCAGTPLNYVASVEPADGDSFFILKNGIEAGYCGRALVAGTAFVPVEVSSASHSFVTAKEGKLISADHGVPILFTHDPDGKKTGDLTCLILLCGGASAPSSGTAEYSGYFKLVDASENTDGVVTHKIKIVDGATYHGESSFDSLCKVNNVTFYIPAYTSDAITEKLYFYLKYTPATETGQAKVEIISHSTNQLDTIFNSYYQLGRVFLNDGNMTIQQDHVTGVPQIFFYGVCS